jgi:hypothetical protein
MAHAKISQAKKSEKQTNQESVALAWRHHEAEKLAVELEQVLKSPACPKQLHDAIVDCLSEIQSRNDCYNVDFLMGLFLSRPRQAEAEGGAQ